MIGLIYLKIIEHLIGNTRFKRNMTLTHFTNIQKIRK